MRSGRVGKIAFYDLNAHERQHKVVITSGKLGIFFKSELGGVAVRKHGGIDGWNLRSWFIMRMVYAILNTSLSGFFSYNKTS